MKIEYLSCADTAKHIRAALKAAFPGIKFGVRSSTYAGGASIRVGWTDGPTVKMVEEIGGSFAGGRFDGSIDLKSSVRHWLMPDGSVTLASDPGTVENGGSRPAHREWMPDPAAKLVRFGADYVFCDRALSARFVRHACAKLVRDGHAEFAAVEIEDRWGGNAWIKDDRRRLNNSPDWSTQDIGTLLRATCSRLVLA
jgi:hypothetical protein